MKVLVAAVVAALGVVAAPHQRDAFGALAAQAGQHVLEPLVQEPHGGPQTDKTIYQYLSQQPKFTKLVHLIDIDEKYVELLNSTDSEGVTFFAPDNDALTPKRPHKREGSTNLASLYEALEGGGGDDEERKKWLKKILHALLKYHTLTTKLAKPELYVNATYETTLKAADGAYDGQPRRIGVTSGLLGSLFINGYAKTEFHEVEASNGIIYVLNHPLFPPPSILDELFFIPKVASTLTSALQKVGLEGKLQWHHWNPNKEPEGDGPVVTLFAPTNRAFDKLPPRLRAFLFSPVGAKALKKLLEYHIVPSYILHSDWIHKASESSEMNLVAEETLVGQLGCFASGIRRSLRLARGGKCGKSKRMLSRPTFDLPILESETVPHWPWRITQNITVPTLLGDDQTINVVVVKPNSPHAHDVPHADVEVGTEMVPWFRSAVRLNNVQASFEAVSGNGALYFLDWLLKPKWKPDGEHEDEENAQNWDDWESWLPAWAEEE